MRFVATMRRSDFWQVFGRTPFTRLRLHLPLPRNLPDLPGMHVLPLHARCALGPRWNLRTLACRMRLAACGEGEHLGFHTLCLTGLNRFTLSHCGSHAPMPTLEPHLAASAPRLGTDCLLGFVRPGLPPGYTTYTEPAHLLFRPSIASRKGTGGAVRGV